jgi:nitrate/nitrite transporter NarK
VQGPPLVTKPIRVMQLMLSVVIFICNYYIWYIWYVVEIISEIVPTTS